MGAHEARDRVRAACRALPGVNERPENRHPARFVRDRPSSVVLTDDHHRAARLALWRIAAPERNAALLDADPDAYFLSVRRVRRLDRRAAGS